MCESGRATTQLALWACVVCFSEKDSLITLDRATELGSWIYFYFFATSRSSTNHLAMIPAEQVEIICASTFERSHWIARPDSHKWKPAITMLEKSHTGMRKSFASMHCSHKTPYFCLGTGCRISYALDSLLHEIHIPTFSCLGYGCGTFQALLCRFDTSVIGVSFMYILSRLTFL